MHQYMLELIACLVSEPLLQCDLVHTHFYVRQGIGAQVIRVVDYVHFAQKMFKILNIPF